MIPAKELFPGLKGKKEGTHGLQINLLIFFSSKSGFISSISQFALSWLWGKGSERSVWGGRGDHHHPYFCLSPCPAFNSAPNPKSILSSHSLHQFCLLPPSFTSASTVVLHPSLLGLDGFSGIPLPASQAVCFGKEKEESPWTAGLFRFLLTSCENSVPSEEEGNISVCFLQQAQLAALSQEVSKLGKQPIRGFAPSQY